MQQRQLRHYMNAVQNLAEHRDIPYADAEKILNRWLILIPIKFHQCMATLLAAHIVMRKDEIQSFLSQVKNLINASDKNPFCIKRLEDMGGTQRLLISDLEINRRLSVLHPINIMNVATEATVIVENIISGNQIISAFKYYMNPEHEPTNHMYAVLTPAQRIQLKSKLNGLRRIKICTVLYTQEALHKLRDELRRLISPDLDVEVISGRDMGRDAYFSSTTKIGATDKHNIRHLLSDANEMESFRCHFNRLPNNKLGRLMNLSDINNANLVARYQSLPKKAFWFLSTGLRADPNCRPFVRISEDNEIKRPELNS